MHHLLRLTRLIPCIAVATISMWAASAESSERTEAVRKAIFQQINDYRAENEDGSMQVGGSLQRDEDLMKAAQEFAAFMAETNKYGHRADGRTPAERAESAGYDYCVVRENIAYRSNTGQVSVDSLTETIVQGWIESPPHKENILADYVTETGIGVATDDGVTFYAVQLFGRPRSEQLTLRIENQTNQVQTLAIRSGGNRDDVELPANVILTLKRCYPTTLSLQGDEQSRFEVRESIRLRITASGLAEVE